MLKITQNLAGFWEEQTQTFAGWEHNLDSHLGLLLRAQNSLKRPGEGPTGPKGKIAGLCSFGWLRSFWGVSLVSSVWVPWGA